MPEMTSDTDQSLRNPRARAAANPGARKATDPGARAATNASARDAVPAIARVAAGVWVRTTIWGLQTSIRVGNRVVRAATSPDAAVALVDEVRAGVRSYARELLGITELDARVRALGPGPGPGSVARARAREPSAPDGAISLRAQGAELLSASAEIDDEDSSHPAYAGILLQLAPDEGRILRLLALEGPQPTVDVREANLIGVGSQLVGQGLNMIGAEAGLRYIDRVPRYVNNLYRLGLIRFSEDPIDDPMRYQVLEGQPATMRAIKRAGRPKTVHRSLRLTPFGKDFCDVVLPLDPAEIEALTAG
jgi:hypothetical protein